MRSKSIAAVVGALALALPASAMAGNGQAQTSSQWSETIRTAESQAQAAQNDTVVCNQAAGGNTSGSSQCEQDNSSTDADVDRHRRQRRHGEGWQQRTLAIGGLAGPAGWQRL